MVLQNAGLRGALWLLEEIRRPFGALEEQRGAVQRAGPRPGLIIHETFVHALPFFKPQFSQMETRVMVLLTRVLRQLKM